MGALLLSSGCPGPSASDGDPWIELGVGRQAWEPFGEDAELVFGSQGGWHVDLALRFGGWEPDELALEYLAVDVETDEQVSYLTTAVLSEASVLVGDDAWERVGDRVVFEIESDDEVLGRAVRFEVVATHGEVELEDEATANVVDEVP
ncbi:MAG: hypothetical protein GY898_27815 [Proteobacteria bacterium]|nr:hypothetical protein [Pseudomonadota bacterium]